MENLDIYEILLQLPALKVTEVKVEEKLITISCTLKVKTAKCPICQMESSTVNQYYERTLRDISMGPRNVHLLVKARQFHCKNCNRFFTQALDFADPNKDHTHRHIDYIFCLGRKQTYTEVAAIVNVSPKTVERIVLDKCKNEINIPARYNQVRRLGIDEHSHQKGKKNYLCILTDLDRGIIIDILPSRKKEALSAHFQGLGLKFCAQITDVSCDYWRPYISVAKTCFPQANIVLDRFHVVKMLNEPLDSFRKRLRDLDEDNPNYTNLKWILYKQYHTLSEDEKKNLELAFIASPKLKQAYFFRERFHLLLDTCNNVEEVVVGFDKWINDLASEKITIFNKFIKTLSKIKGYVANYVLNYLSNAATEGLNNLIRSVRRIAFGMPNFNHLRLRVLAISQ